MVLVASAEKAPSPPAHRKLFRPCRSTRPITCSQSRRLRTACPVTRMQPFITPSTARPSSRCVSHWCHSHSATRTQPLVLIRTQPLVLTQSRCLTAARSVSLLLLTSILSCSHCSMARSHVSRLSRQFPGQFDRFQRWNESPGAQQLLAPHHPTGGWPPSNRSKLAALI